jgi:hypothetical protein
MQTKNTELVGEIWPQLAYVHIYIYTHTSFNSADFDYRHLTFLPTILTNTHRQGNKYLR